MEYIVLAINSFTTLLLTQRLELGKPEDETSEETCGTKCLAFRGKTDRQSSQVKQGSPYNMEPGQKMILQDDYN